VALVEFEDAREQVYRLRLEAVQRELALLSAQCGVDYSLTLAGGPQRQLEVFTSGAAGCVGGGGETGRGPAEGENGIKSARGCGWFVALQLKLGS
jgi:hypothetical protein